MACDTGRVKVVGYWNMKPYSLVGGYQCSANGGVAMCMLNWQQLGDELTALIHLPLYTDGKSPCIWWIVGFAG
jgi:hypothetical protein